MAVLKRIHVNGHHLRMNRKNGTNLPVLTVKDYRSNRKGQTVSIDGPSVLKYRPHAPLKSGAVAWIETYGDVYVE